MDLQGSLVDSSLRIYPSQHMITFLETLPDDEDVPGNIMKLIGRNCKGSLNEHIADQNLVHFSNGDLKNIESISKFVKDKMPPSETDVNELKNDATMEKSNKEIEIDNKEEKSDKEDEEIENCSNKEKSGDTPEKQIGKDSKKDNLTDSKNSKEKQTPEKELGPFLTTSDVYWLYSYLQKGKLKGDDVPYLHALLEGSNVQVPENKVLKRNPELEARCVKLRAQQEAREYKKLTKNVDNVRLRFPEDSISYQMKQINRHLIAVGQFLISIFAGFLFGFRGVEWMVGNLDLGFRLLLGVMCALVIALAEIYFLAKQLNEELNIPETTQLGGPTKFAEPQYRHLPSKELKKEHQD